MYSSFRHCFRHTCHSPSQTSLSIQRWTREPSRVILIEAEEYSPLLVLLATARFVQWCIGNVDRDCALGCGHIRQQPLRLRRPEGQEEP